MISKVIHTTADRLEAELNKFLVTIENNKIFITMQSSYSYLSSIGFVSRTVVTILYDENIHGVYKR